MEEIKADGARTTTLLSPTPTHLTGKDAWAQDSVSSWRLHSDVRAFLMTSSSSATPGDELQSDVRSKYSRRKACPQKEECLMSCLHTQAWQISLQLL